MIDGEEGVDQIIHGSSGQLHSFGTESHYLTNQVFRKTYVQIKRSIDDWLRLKNMKKVVKSEKPE